MKFKIYTVYKVAKDTVEIHNKCRKMHETGKIAKPYWETLKKI